MIRTLYDDSIPTAIFATLYDLLDYSKASY